MKQATVSLLIPVLNEAENLPGLFRALIALRTNAEIIFIDNGSEDGSVELLEKFRAGYSSSRLLFEKKRGFAEPLNRGLAEAKGEYLLFLDADALPASNWVDEMCRGLAENDIVAGNTSSYLMNRPTPHGKLALQLFQGHSEATIHAEGYALPWAPTCNLGVKRSLFAMIDLFSPEAGGAFDIDWCWRAVLHGASLAYLPRAKVKHRRRNEREPLLRQFDRYGRSEAWLQRTYVFLTGDEEESDPLMASIDAFHRLQGRAKKFKSKPAQKVLAEVAAAFASGVRAGHSGFFRPCALKRPRPTAAVSWENKSGGITVFVSGKGVTEFAGKGLQAWEAYKNGASDGELAKLMTKLFKVPAKEALAEAREFKKALQV
jgi:glycosyltransferase involved in cell wall biosynthesis